MGRTDPQPRCLGGLVAITVGLLMGGARPPECESLWRVTCPDQRHAMGRMGVGASLEKLIEAGGLGRADS